MDGLEDVTYEITMIDGEVTDRQASFHNVLQDPVTQITVTGTKLKNGMVAKLGSGSFVWPVPGYKYVSRWMGNGHRGGGHLRCLRHADLRFRLRHRHCRRLALLLRQLRRIDHGNGYKTLYAHMSRIAGHPGSGRQQDGPDRLCRLHR